MKKLTLCLCIKENRVLLAMKKRGFGVGKWNGYGGKVKADEEPHSAAIRELQEESGLVLTENQLQKVALLNFYFDGKHMFECHAFIAEKWQGDPIETEEMKPQWFLLSSLPYDEMWAADNKWIPMVLAGKQIKADIKFNTDGSIVEDFSYELTSFN